MGCESANQKRHLRNQTQVKKVTLTETDKAILDCKTCRDKIKRYIKNLEQKEQKSREKAKELLKKKHRERAKLYLRQSKLFSEQTKVAEGQLEMINEQIANIESTTNLAQCAAVLKQGNSVLKNLQNEVNIEHWENIRDDLDELKERDAEIKEFFKEKGLNEEEFDEQCEDELNKLIAEVQGEKIDLPSAPKDSLNDDNIVIENKKKNKNKVKKKVINA